MCKASLYKYIHSYLVGLQADLETRPISRDTVKPILNSHTQKEDQKLVFNTNYRLMQVKSIAECSPWSILQYF